MKGMVFTIFFEMIEKAHGYEMVDELIEETKPASGGAYTSVGTYSHGEIVQYLVYLSNKTGQSIPDLLQAFGKYLFGVFVNNYGDFFKEPVDTFSFLKTIEDYIHVEVLKLYPEAELPHFEVSQINEHVLQFDYHSDRHMSDLAHGLIEATLDHYGEQANIEKYPLHPNGSAVRFLITKQV